MKIHTITFLDISAAVRFIVDPVQMRWRKTLDFLFKSLAVSGWKDCAAKFVVILGIIAGSQMLFSLIYLGDVSRSYAFYGLSAFFVGGPWIALFFIVSSYQVGLQKKLSRLSRKDGLTGLNNRRTFFELTQRPAVRATGGVVMMIDADNFKSINDTYGHGAGDECLKAIAYRIGRNLRDQDVGGRLGGEEFAVYLSGANLAQARVIAERLVTPIPYSRPDMDDNFTVTLSVGGVEAASDQSIDLLLNRADQALYCAKEAGKAQLSLWTEDVQQSGAAAA